MMMKRNHAWSKNSWIPLTLLCMLLAGVAVAEEGWSPEQRQVLASIGELSAATAPDGAGADAYAALLVDEFSRWTVGSDRINDKKAWVEGVREWFDDGWRVVERRSRNLEIEVRAGHAFVRRIVEETYRGPGGAESTSSAALAEVWIRESDRWLLLRVDAHPLGQA